MTYRRFTAGQEVTIVTPSHASNSDKFTHLTVERLAANGAQVILSDGSKWRQDGRLYGAGATYHSRFDKRLTDRKNGVQSECWQVRSVRATSLRKSLDGLLTYLGDVDIRSAEKREAAVAVAEEVVAFFRDLSGEGDL